MIDNYVYIYKRDKPFLFKLIAFIIAAFALLRLMNTPIFSFVLGLASTLIFVYQTGIEIDFNNKKYRLTTTFGPQVFGEWLDLPEIQYISFFKTNIVSTATGYSNTSISHSQEVIQVNLIVGNNKILRMLEVNNQNEAYELAKFYALKLKVDIYDATVRPAKWINFNHKN